MTFAVAVLPVEDVAVTTHDFEPTAVFGGVNAIASPGTDSAPLVTHDPVQLYDMDTAFTELAISDVVNPHRMTEAENEADTVGMITGLITVSVFAVVASSPIEFAAVNVQEVVPTFPNVAVPPVVTAPIALPPESAMGPVQT